jgi:hypothetical protein
MIALPQIEETLLNALAGLLREQAVAPGILGIYALPRRKGRRKTEKPQDKGRE